MSPAGAGAKTSHGSAIVFAGSIVDMQASLVQDQSAGVVLVHQRNVVRGDDDGGARFVEFDEQPQQALAEVRIDIAGGLVGEQKLGRAITARAMAMRCFSPPDSAGGKADICSPSPTHSSSSMTSAR